MPRVVKIAHINTEKTFRGGERQTVLLIKALEERGVGSVLFCRRGSALSSAARKEGIDIRETAGGYDVLKGLIKGSGDYDIIHSHAARAQGFAALARFLAGKPHVYTRRVVFRHRKRRITGLKYRLTDRVVCISNAVKNALLLQGFDNGKLAVVYNAVPRKAALDRKRAEDLLKALNVPEDKAIVGNIAALTEEKDHESMLMAASKVEGASFLILGDGKLRGRLEERIRELGLDGRVFLAGFRENVEDFFSVFDVFLMPSLEEGFGNVVLDAFLYRVPVVATDTGGLREIVIDGKTGFLVPVRDHRAMAARVSMLLNNREEALRLSESAYEFARERFSTERMVAGYMAVYESCLEGRAHEA